MEGCRRTVKLTNSLRLVFRGNELEHAIAIADADNDQVHRSSPARPPNHWHDTSPSLAHLSLACPSQDNEIVIGNTAGQLAVFKGGLLALTSQAEVASNPAAASPQACRRRRGASVATSALSVSSAA